MAFRIYCSIEQRKKLITSDDLKDLLMDLRTGQLQSFKEKIEERPEFLKCKYKGHSLLFWCKKYNILAANKIIIELMRKE